MSVRILSIVLSVCCSLSLSAQSVRSIKNIGIGINHRSSDSALVTHAQVGLVSSVDSLKGIQAGLLSSVTWRKMSGLSIGGFHTLNVGKASGVQAAVNGNFSIGGMKGLQASFVTNTAHRLSGVQLAGFTNIMTAPGHAIQIAGVTNVAMGLDLGMQFSPISNICSSSMRGVQVGAYNYADTLSGSQFGLLNIALHHPRGWQFGIVNYSRDTVAHKVGLVNINPKTRIDILTFVGNTSAFNVGLRFRNRSTYNIVGLGTHYFGLDKHFSGALYYRLGQYFTLSPRWSVSGDVGFYHIESFQENNQDSPERLYSLQVHANLDYQLTPALGLFGSIGYGDTRYYAHNRSYKNGLIGQLGLFVRWRGNRSGREPVVREDNPLIRQNAAADGPGSLYAYDAPWYGQRRPGSAAIETAGVNVLVWAFDRFVTNEDFSRISLNAWKSNFQHAFVWDNDPFHTNTFFHPYHGSLYFNSARSNGLSFWQSVPYAIGGSMMWEFLGECEPPAINDLFATSMGGICLGEITNRVSHLILNDRTRGFGRFLRELSCTILNPAQEINRLLSGDAWRVRTDHYLYHDYSRFPIDFSVSAGIRYLADDGGLFRGEPNPFVTLYLSYGDPFNTDERKPFDFFNAEATIGLSGNQPLFNTVHLLGRLLGRTVESQSGLRADIGLYQHFNYYDSKPVKNGTSITPYLISEAAAIGPGIIISLPAAGALQRLEQRAFISGIFLGGYKTDFYNIIDRDYNLGSGYSIKTKTQMELRNFGRFIMHANYYRLFTWKGVEGRQVEGVNPLFLNVQGNKGNAELVEFNPIWEFDFSRSMSVVLGGSYFIRHSRYSAHADVQVNTFELKAGLTCHL